MSYATLLSFHRLNQITAAKAAMRLLCGIREIREIRCGYSYMRS